MRNWYVLKDGEVQGPFDREQIRRMAWTGNLDPDDPVTCDRFPFWYPARDISGLEFPHARTGEAVPAARESAGREPPAGSGETDAGAILPPMDEPAGPPPAAAAIPTTPRSLPVAVPVPPLPPSEARKAGRSGDSGTPAPPTPARPASSAAAVPVEPVLPPAAGAQTSGTGSPAVSRRQRRKLSRKKRTRREPLPEIEVVDEGNDGSGLTGTTAVEEAPGVNIDWELVGKTILVLLAVTLVVLPIVVWRVWSARHPRRSHSAPGMTRVRIVETAGEVLGKYLALKWPGSKAMLVVPPRNCSDFQPDLLSAARAGLTRGFGGDVRMVGEVAPEMSVAKKVAWEKKSKGNEHIPALRYWLDAGAMDAALEKCSDADVIVSLVGLPSDMDLMHFWRTPAAVRPAVAVLLGDVPPGKTQRALKAGWLAAVTDYNPGNNLRYAFLTPEQNQVFSRYCRLVTPENVKVLARRYSDLFAR